MSELMPVSFFEAATNGQIRELCEEEGCHVGCYVRMRNIRSDLAKKYGYEYYNDIPTKLLSFQEFCNAEIDPKTPYSPYGYTFAVAKSDYEEMITW